MSFTILKTVSINFNDNLSFTGGVHLFGFEAHAGLGFGVGLSQLTVGGSKDLGGGKSVGDEVSIQPGLGAAAVF